MADAEKMFKKSELLGMLKTLLEVEGSRATYTDCEEYRKQGKVSAIEGLIELIENS
ncbi:MAG: hypothetical protein IJK26_09955 [Clostridia bacterium]|nr:hypothetical protein [Clostridia bacterium]